MDIVKLALQRNRYPEMSDADFRFMLQQIDGRQRTQHKLPTMATIADWWYPVRLSLEQCSGERTARYKAQLLQSVGAKGHLVDLTSGYGVDDYFLSDCFSSIDYVEQDAELCRIAEHNFSLTHKPIRVHHTTAEEFLTTFDHADVIYLDPARRDNHGGKVFRLKDCTPHVVEMLPELLHKADRVLLKLSPMLDIQQAFRELGKDWDAYVVAVDNEVKEVLMLSGGTGQVTAVDLSLSGDRPHVLSFRAHFEGAVPEGDRPHVLSLRAHFEGSVPYLLEPSAALMKVGCFELLAQHYGVTPLAPNTHLFTAPQPIADWQGRQWKVIKQGVKDAKDLVDPTTNQKIVRAHVLTRNYPLKPEALARKMKLSEGDPYYVIGATVGTKPTIFLCI